VSIWGLFKACSTYLGLQWCVGDWGGFIDATGRELDPALFEALLGTLLGAAAEPTQQMKEYDPEWSKACIEGTISASRDHAQMLAKAKCPVLFTHHGWILDEKTGMLLGAMADQQVDQVERLVKTAGQPFTRLSFPQMGHAMHSMDPALFVRTLFKWAVTLPTGEATKM
jgi:hypothetical protein